MEERKGEEERDERFTGRERSHFLSSPFLLLSSPPLHPPVHGVCNFNYFISGNPWNIQRRYRMEGELVHVAVLNRLYFSSSRRNVLPFFVLTSYRLVPLSRDLSPSLRLYSIFTLFSLLLSSSSPSPPFPLILSPRQSR